MSLVESIGDATLTIALSFGAVAVRLLTAEMDDALRWSQTVVDLAEGDPPHQRQPRHRITLGSGTGVSGRCAVVAGQSGMARGLGLLRGFGPTHRPGNSRLSRGLEVWDSYSERRPARRRQRAAGDR
jgi:hypothetical protein